MLISLDMKQNWCKEKGEVDSEMLKKLAKSVSLLILSVILAGCAGSPARMMFQSEEATYNDFNSMSTNELCRRYMKAVLLYKEKPHRSAVKTRYFRANPIIERILVERNLPARHCYDEGAVTRFERQLEEKRLREERRKQQTVSSSLGRKMLFEPVGTPKYSLEQSGAVCEALAESEGDMVGMALEESGRYDIKGGGFWGGVVSGLNIQSKERKFAKMVFKRCMAENGWISK